MRAQRVAMVGVLGLVVAACIATGPADPGPKSSTRAPSSTGSAPSTPTVSSLTGPSTFDWSSSRVTGRATRGVPQQELIAANAAARPEWSGSSSTLVTTGSPVTASPAVYGATWVEGSSPSALDKLFFGVNGSSGITGGVYTSTGAPTTATGANFFALTNLYAGSGSPVLAWSATLSSGGIDRTGISLSPDATKVYALDTSGVLHCLTTATGAACSTWSTYAAACAVHGSSPWVSYSTGDLYFGDDCGWAYHISGSTGTAIWKVQPGASASFQTKFESSPVVVNGYVYIGDDYGQLFRLTDSGPPVANTSTVAVFDVCSAIGQTAPCPNGFPSGSGPWAIRAPIAFDTTGEHAYVVANDYVFELNGNGGNWAQTASSPKHLQSGVNGTTNGPMSSSAVLDYTNKYLYAALNSRLFKIAYPFTGSATAGVYTAALAEGTGTANPIADPLPYNSVTYVGDIAGYTERFDCTTSPGANAVDGVTANVGSSISASGVLDYSTGNVNFGVTTSSGGGLMQWPLAVSAYTCPSGTKLCSSANSGLASACVAAGGSNYGEACRACCTNADCSGATPVCASGGTCVSGCTGGPGAAGSCTTTSQPNTSVTCSAATGGTCVYSCNSGYANCTGNIATAGCTVVTSTDVNNCGGCGNICSSNNIPTPQCTAGVCTGHCADGSVDCDGNRLTNGCESSAACGTSGCCGNTCPTGTTCYDNGGTGTCVSGQTTEASGTNSQNNVVTLTCPTGQLITSIVFADYGTPGGVGGQSWSTTSPCGNYTTSGTCTPNAGCAWNGGQCVAYACWNETTSSACSGAPGCTWVAATGTCTTTTCASLTTSTTCAAQSGCAWNSALSVCTASFGFLHDYGTSPNNKYPPNCALDVSADSVITTGCLYSVGTCSFTAKDSYLGTGTATASGSTLPLTTTSPNPSGYPSDPCPSLPKSLYIQASCGYCANECTTGSQCGSGTCTAGRCATPSCAPSCPNGSACNVNSDCATGICTGNVCKAPACSGSCGEGTACGSTSDCSSGVCSNAKCQNPSCTPVCADGAACGSGSDCASGTCTNNKCVTPSCSPTCGDGAKCGSSSDCAIGTCTNGKCQDPSCSPDCTTGQTCGSNADCATQLCTSGKCVAASCSPSCTLGQGCGSNADCGSGVCNYGRCQKPSCSPTCADGAGCSTNTDCGSNVCTNGKCAAPSCSPTCPQGSDCGSSADCLGGVACTNGICAPGTGNEGSNCTLASQCASGICTGGKCAAPSCNPNCVNGTSCGSNGECVTGVCTNGKCEAQGCAPACNQGNTCGANSDCTSGICTSGKCANPSCSPNCVNGATCGGNGDCATGVCTNGLCHAQGCAPSCNQGNSCGSSSDCTSGLCTSGKCATPSCAPNCANGATCGGNGDCATGVCTDGTCQSQSCEPSCNNGTSCGANGDCASGVCTSGKCVSPSCSPLCANGGPCGTNSDCASTNCHYGTCQAASCAPTCNDGNTCGANGDCASDVCSAGKCQTPVCANNCVTGSPCGQNSDCASSRCNNNLCSPTCANTCATGVACGQNSDCSSGTCTSGVCK